MNGAGYRVDIDRLIISDLELTPAQAERLRVQTADTMQRLLAQRRWPSKVLASKVARLELPSLSLEAMPDPGRLATELAQRLIEVLPGGRETNT